MDSAAHLQSIAGMLVTLADEAVEPLLVTFDALVDASDVPCRPEAAALLRAIASDCPDRGRAERLLAAADALEAGRPAALTAEGRTWKEATVAAGKTPVEEWKTRAAAMSADEQRAAAEQYPVIQPVIIMGKMPRLPRLRVRQFFRGLVVRLGRPVVDVDGITAPAGQRLEFLSMWTEGPEETPIYHLEFAERRFRLEVKPQDDRSIIGNGGNAWFYPLPEIDSLTSLWRIVDDLLTKAENDIDDEDGDQIDSDMLLAIRTDLDDCGNWLNDEEVGGPPPLPECAPVAAEYFGKKSDMYNWVNLLFAAIPFCVKPGPADGEGRPVEALP